MARIFFAWELGGEYGHALACATLARSLQAHGHSIALAFREARAFAVLPETRDYDIFVAPQHPYEGVAALPASIPDILTACGYRDAEMLGVLLDGWLALLRQWRPDLVVCDFAPTALLAARMLGLPRVTYGNGFFTPPRLDPLPAFRFDEPVAPERLRESNDRILAIVNGALAARGAAPLERLADQFEADEDFLCTFPELDHYASRPTSGYWGPRFRFDRGREVQWPRGNGRRVIVYVKRALPQLDALIDYLARSTLRVLAYIPELEETRRARLAAAHVVVTDRPMRLDGPIRDCELVISHGGEGMSGGAVTHGVPQIVTPSHYEQYLTARRVEQLGVGAWVAGNAPAASIASAIEHVLAEPRYRANAQAFARRYPQFSSAEQRRRIVLRMEEILAARSILSRPPAAGAPE